MIRKAARSKIHSKTATIKTTPKPFPLKKYGYALEEILNNKNRWGAKIVCSILDRNSVRCVSTTYLKRIDYLRLLETTALLNLNNKLSPKIAGLYPKNATVVCDYIGEFLTEYLLKNPARASLCVGAVLDYLNDINSINRSERRFIIPPIIKEACQLTREFVRGFEFLPGVKDILPRLEDSSIKFGYGYGIEDPHLWNFRVVKTMNGLGALTTDFDYFSERINYFWEVGYFYATFRWLKKTSVPLGRNLEKALFSLTQTGNLKSEFMFWLGVLSSYCGYKESLRLLAMNNRVSELARQYALIKQLDERVAVLAQQILKQPQYLSPASSGAA